MSRLWTESGLRVCLLEDSVSFINVRGGIFPVVTEARRIEFDSGDWAQAMGAFAEGLQMASPSSSVHVVLGAQWVRYLMLPWSLDVARRDFREALAVALFEHQYQMPALDFKMLQGPCAFGRPILIACVAQEVMMNMAGVIQSRGLRRGSVRPLLAAVWDCHHAKLQKYGGTLLIHESSRLLCVKHSGGYIQSVSIRPGKNWDLAPFATSCEGAVQVVVASDATMLPNAILLKPKPIRHSLSGMVVSDLAYYGAA